jgi:hypothetical protein
MYQNEELLDHPHPHPHPHPHQGNRVHITSLGERPDPRQGRETFWNKSKCYRAKCKLYGAIQKGKKIFDVYQENREFYKWVPIQQQTKPKIVCSPV